MGTKCKLYNTFETDGVFSSMVTVIPATTIKCVPPIIEGEKYSCWIKYRKESKPKNKEQLEKCIGFSIRGVEA